MGGTMPIEIKTMEEAARLYRKVEASLERKAVEYEAATTKEKEALKQLEVIMRAMLNQAGVAVMDVPGVAEVTIVPKRTFSSSDWDMTHTLIPGGSSVPGCWSSQYCMLPS
jgi:hypothetical protein